ncbi:hypothetical protein GCM10007301_18380 [Azorhizobium oxalatiphilum]|uniref:Phenylacetaldoxime dehydratase n=1 Tax=Azorhizobium oxalatiphilum TaxID=980631 RepID=A0A917BUC1_9HYPH|nr:phenylacetaldoxime dehydratase family protein [Azorhizobium oxalatiphilum]GGF59013.1 hypothetical protein GCM10007301_18380 [Azorhizobium oxalatiphilum]
MDAAAREVPSPTDQGITFMDTAPVEAVGPVSRIAPIRKPDGFVPAVQRWSFLLPEHESTLRVAFFGAQAATAEALAAHPLHDWARAHLVGHPSGPTCVDHARSRLPGGQFEHVVCAYWVDGAAFDTWRNDAAVQGWWDAPERLRGPFGTWREVLTVPRDRQESIYWKDYPAGLMRSPEVSIFPTPYCGYYGAMRDRIPLAATDPLETPLAEPAFHPERAGFGERWHVRAPANLAVIRSANTWGRMDAEQLADYEVKLRVPLEAGMDFLADNPQPTGCLSMRWQGTVSADGATVPEEHALAYFLSLGHMERWAEGHATHAAIFGAAIQRYRHFGARNQLRTWHEVYVLPEGEQTLDYINCAPETGLLRWFEADRIA